MQTLDEILNACETAYTEKIANEKEAEEKVCAEYLEAVRTEFLEPLREFVTLLPNPEPYDSNCLLQIPGCAPIKFRASVGGRGTFLQSFKVRDAYFDISEEAIGFARQPLPEVEPNPIIPRLYDQLRTQVAVAAEHFDEQRHERGMEFLMLAVAGALVDAAESLDILANH